MRSAMGEGRRRPVVGGLVAALAAAGLGLGSGATAEVGSAGGQDSAEASKPRALTVRPAAEPVPSLKYRLVPLESERNPGDAAPVYLRLGLELRDEAMKEIDTRATDWLARPIDEFPTDEARAMVASWGGRLRQIHIAARRQTCDWAYPVAEQREEIIEILLPDVQGLRTWARLLAVKARLEVVEGRYDEAVETIQTGMAMARHVGGGPFLINALVGTAMANQMLERVEELVARPDAPNLYWALAVLPDPLIDFRNAIAHEQKVVTWMVPELTDLDADRTPAEWEARLGRLFVRMRRLEAKLAEYDEAQATPLKAMDVASFRATLLPEARAYLADRRGSTDGLTDDQMIVLHAAGQLDELRDLAYRPTYLPYPEARTFYASESYDRATHRLDGTPLGVLGSLLASIRKGHEAEVRQLRTIAALRAVEALRLHAASHDGRLPGSLDEVRAVPVPIDPTTGRPFAYRIEGEAAVLSSPAVGEPANALAYRITVAR